MLGHITAKYLGEQDNIFKGKDGKDIQYRQIGLQNPEKKLDIMVCGIDLNYDLSKLVENELYMFVVNIPSVVKSDTRLRVLDVVPFKVDKK